MWSLNHLSIYNLLLEIQLLREKGWDPIKRFNPATSLCLSQDKTWIFNVTSLCLSQDKTWIFNITSLCLSQTRTVICCDHQLRREVIVHIGGIVDHHCLNYRNFFLPCLQFCVNIHNMVPLFDGLKKYLPTRLALCFCIPTSVHDILGLRAVAVTVFANMSGMVSNVTCEISEVSLGE